MMKLANSDMANILEEMAPDDPSSNAIQYLNYHKYIGISSMRQQTYFNLAKNVHLSQFIWSKIRIPNPYFSSQA